MLGAFLPVLAATDAAGSGADDGKQRSGVSAFPSEEPSDEELRAWLKANYDMCWRGGRARGQPKRLVEFTLEHNVL